MKRGRNQEDKQTRQTGGLLAKSKGEEGGDRQVNRPGPVQIQAHVPQRLRSSGGIRRKTMQANRGGWPKARRIACGKNKEIGSSRILLAHAQISCVRMRAIDAKTD